ncbi:hypothetical protein PSHT_05966 [Puccinia striiformis]|uniref:RING-type E3 ubiquitin transferase n=1 Tax=Puccinia striiformis TaxID=27350 RepID=A0A2S4W988_9BASI|nr:hypothetical protein PSHT_05966 [Puccinia striiformis]
MHAFLLAPSSGFIAESRISVLFSFLQVLPRNLKETRFPKKHLRVAPKLRGICIRPPSRVYKELISPTQVPFLISTITSPRAPSKRTPPHSPTAPTASNTNPSIHHNMDPNANPSDSQPVADLPETSPGGIGPVEESSGANPTVNVERAEGVAAPEELFPPHAGHAEEGEWIELPEEMNALNGDPAGGIPVAFQDLFAQLADIAPTGPADHPIGLPPLEEVLQTVTPEQDRVFLRNFLRAGNEIITELTDNPQQRVYSLPEMDARLGGFEEVSRIVENLPAHTARLITTFINRMEDGINRLDNTPARIEMARQDVHTLLDSYINASIAALPSDGTQTDSPSCTICQEHYVESDVTVSLPCHNSHHFHRACILDWLQTLVPEPLTCPICRTAVQQVAPPNPAQLH